MIVGQLRSGHCPKTKYYRHRIWMEEYAACKKCGEVEENDNWMEGVSVERLWVEDWVTR